MLSQVELQVLSSHRRSLSLSLPLFLSLVHGNACLIPAAKKKNRFLSPPINTLLLFSTFCEIQQHFSSALFHRSLQPICSDHQPGVQGLELKLVPLLFTSPYFCFCCQFFYFIFMQNLELYYVIIKECQLYWPFTETSSLSPMICFLSVRDFFQREAEEGKFTKFHLYLICSFHFDDQQRYKILKHVSGLHSSSKT